MLAPCALFPFGQDAAQFLNQLDLVVPTSMIPEVHLAQKSSWLKTWGVGLNASACLALLNGTSAHPLFDEADSSFYTNSDFLEFDALLESADSNNGDILRGNLRWLEQAPFVSCMSVALAV